MTSHQPSSTAGPLSVILIILITGLIHLLGTAVLCLITSGWQNIGEVPFVAFFGFWFLLPELVGVTAQWAAFDSARGFRSFLPVLLVSVGAGTLFMALFGPKEQGRALLWTGAYGAAAASAGTCSMCLVAAAKRLIITVRTIRLLAPS